MRGQATIGRRLVVFGFAAGVAAAGTAHAGDRARITVSATVLAHTSLKSLRTPDFVAVTAEDIARGYVELARPVELEVLSNHARGILLGFHARAPWVRAVRVNDAAQSMVFLAKAGKGLAAQALALKVRLELAPEARPGTLAWPLAVFVAPD